ncbi:CDK5 regulatory subunit-associated protein 3-like isoform X1 [Limulus polyphemus]|uniref:CDK5 regulatory subunit-associated protein 3-like isoform X1 n=2 Tax=Limulus polyphemus TaxID=6850 RepID=A0ABM1B3Q1_LIMPO|nr:CDK5 regulatory subunit-associated protein 3-like isoform X1 [Limulus polyphemus]XP_013774183.1 CDK5 regulatory subunit-associated protein 3-like isoform X1 [Limulus polyphemus]XP_022241279.1 CDK5 regulatory subunit-associated protein 3-like isoform X1 [Limulus polyphemus]XP_022241280.1 CDK5 regulatory subunit-associated protein 3-like isoform X1 [Limulus polyphemus]
MQLQKEQELPIDIHTNKLLDWLISRRVCKQEWQENILTVREKINNAIQDMPAVEEITQLLAGTYINYFHCLQIIELLKETESDSKNIFGRYSSQRMKDWQEVVKLYEKDNVFLAEAAQLLIRNVNYEVPSLKKQIAKCQQTQEECNRKEEEYAKNAIQLKEKFYETCKQLGIEGVNIRKELVSLLNDLPDIFSRVTERMMDLNSAREYYVEFLNFTLKRDDIKQICVPLIGHLIEKGNTTTYEWRTGTVPEVVEGSQPKVPLDMDNGQSSCVPDDQIDFGSDGIDFGDDQSSSTLNGDFVHVDKIDFDDGEQAISLDDGGEINWDISVETSGISDLAEVSESVTDKGGGDSVRVARGSDALTLLDNPETRSLFLNELMELKGFLSQRIVEMKTEGDVLLSSQFQEAPATVQLQTADEVQKMLDMVTDILTQMTNVRMKHLCLISDSPKYVDRLTESLRQKLEQSEKMELSKQAVMERRKTILEDQRQLEPKLDLIIKKTKILQKQIEDTISKQYKNRPVNIMGGISVM